jgi:ribokinase
MRTDRLPGPGETLIGATQQRFPGGKGANQALAAQRLGASVALHACVGRDDMSEEALSALRAAGVDLRHCIVTEDAPTGVALIVVDRAGENQIVVASGANARLRAARLDPTETMGLLCQLECPIDAVAETVAAFPGFVCLNLAPALPVPEAMLQRADLIVVNEGEAAYYGSALEAAPGMVAVTHGERGAVLLRAGEEIARSPSPEVSAVDTTGAGDAFCAALTVALLKGAPPAEALSVSCAVGALCVTRPGAQPSFPTLEEAEAFMRRL